MKNDEQNQQPQGDEPEAVTALAVRDIESGLTTFDATHPPESAFKHMAETIKQRANLMTKAGKRLYYQGCFFYLIDARETQEPDPKTKELIDKVIFTLLMADNSKVYIMQSAGGSRGKLLEMFQLGKAEGIAGALGPMKIKSVPTGLEDAYVFDMSNAEVYESQEALPELPPPAFPEGMTEADAKRALANLDKSRSN